MGCLKAPDLFLPMDWHHILSLIIYFSLFLLTNSVFYFPAFEHVSIKLSFLFKGGVSGEGAVAMTAFVLAALGECKCQGVVCR